MLQRVDRNLTEINKHCACTSKCFRPHRIYLQYASSARLVCFLLDVFCARSRTKAKRTEVVRTKEGLIAREPRKAIVN